MRITVLARGGLAVYGGSYDPHRNEVAINTREGESVGVTIAYPSTPSSTSRSASGLTASAPAVSGSKLTTTLTSISDGSYVDITATVGGQVRVIRITARSRTPMDRYETSGE